MSAKKVTAVAVTVATVTMAAVTMVTVTGPHITVTTANINREKRLKGAFFVFSQLCGI